MIGSASRFLTKISSQFDTETIDSSEKDSFFRRQQLTNLIKIYFDFSYCLALSPFRFVKDVSTGLYQVNVWKFQQVTIKIRFQKK